MESENKWLKEQVALAKSIVHGKSHTEPIDVDFETDLAALILSTLSNPTTVVEW